ncbi:MAG TPA: glycogen debranching N-terminal domain-containing protein, partial [Pirellulales bacterium]
MISATDKRDPTAGEHEPDPYYIQAAAPSADERSRVLKHGDTFAVFDHYGDIRPVGMHEQGLYHEGTRFLSCSVLSLGPGRPLFLSSTIKEDNDLLVVDLTNPDIPCDEQATIPRGTLHLLRIKFLWNGVCYERLRIRNYGLSRVEIWLGLHFEADYVDIFEVRGMKRSRRGEQLPPTIDGGTAILGYRGLDEVVRRTRLVFDPQPDKLTASEARFRIALESNQERNLEIAAACELNEKA